MTRRKKLIIASAVGVVVLGTIGALAGGGEAGTEVRIETVGRNDLVATVRATGWVRPRRSVDVQADIMGRITELVVEEGAAVQRGQLLLRIDPSQYEAAVTRAEAAVSAASAREAQVRAGLIQAEQFAKRARELAQSSANLISPQALEEAETQVLVQRALHEASRHDIAQARAALVEARDRLSKTVITAPIDGIVTRLNVEAGEMAIVGTMNNPGSLLLTVSDLAVMEAVIRVDETDIPRIALGDSASIEIDAFPRRKFSGRVTKIGHSGVVPQASGAMAMAARSQAIDFEVVVEITDPPAALRPDLSATADVVTDTRRNAVTIPIIALTVREQGATEPLPQETAEARAAAAAATSEKPTDQEGVFVVREGKAVFVPVEVGIAGTEHFEVIAGVVEGDSIVAGPYEAIRTLQAGALVRAIKDEARPAEPAAVAQESGS